MSLARPPASPASLRVTDRGIDVCALVLLAGSVRRSQLASAAGRPVWQLPLGGQRTVLDDWQAQAGHLARAAGGRPLLVRVLLNHAAPDPEPFAQLAHGADIAPVRLERDPADFRGTGGVIRDLAAAYRPDEYLLVSTAAQVLLEPLPVLVDAMGEQDADVTILAAADGAPGNLFLVRCGAAMELPDIGFIDFKEQALPTLARTCRIRVARCPRPASMPVRTLDDYIAVLRRLHGAASGAAQGAFGENYASTFSVIEDGAQVHPSARLHDCVVLKGGVVEADAVVVRSVVGPRGIVRRGRMAADALVAGEQPRNGR